jgi:hypothetical protein
MYDKETKQCIWVHVGLVGASLIGTLFHSLFSYLKYMGQKQAPIGPLYNPLSV